MFKNSVFSTKIDTKKWFINAGIRALKTFAQTCIAMIPINIVINDIDWGVVVGTAFLSAIISILTSVAGIPEVTCDNDGGDDDADAGTDNTGKC